MTLAPAGRAAAPVPVPVPDADIIILRAATERGAQRSIRLHDAPTIAASAGHQH